MAAGTILRDQPVTRRELEAIAPGSHALIDCDLEGADLSGMDFTGWTFERCNLRKCDLSGVRIAESRWTSCRGAFVNFTGADLSESAILACDFNNGSFRRTVLTATHVTGSKLTGADFTDARTMELRFEESLLINAKLVGFSFRRQSVKKVDFGQADLRKCDFRQAVLDDCSLRDANVAGARFDGADLRSTDLGGIKLSDAGLFRGATISRDQAGQLLGELGLNVR
jgi:fluoroquinolone resistance protein